MQHDRIAEGLTARARRIAAHVAAAVDATEVEHDPFDHFYIEGILPEDVYAELMAKLPAKEAYLPLNPRRWKRADGSSTRDRLYLAGPEMARIDAERRPFWEDIAAALRSDAVRRAVYRKLSRDIAIRLGVRPEEVADQPGWPVLMLVRDTEDYEIKPHPDGQPRVVTMQFYFPHGPEQEGLGTSLYQRGSLIDRLAGRPFREVKRFPYRPNSAYAFAVNDAPGRVSWHGRELVPGSAGVRDTLIVQWRSQPGEAGKDGLRGTADG